MIFVSMITQTAAYQTPIIEVDSNNYDVNVIVGDVRTYIIDHAHTDEMNTTGMMKETRGMNLTLPIGGIDTEIHVNEGTKITVEIDQINSSYITIEQIVDTLDGPVYYPDLILINRSTLELWSQYGPQMIMTTNQTLINQAFAPLSNWSVEINPDSVRIRKDIHNSTHEEYVEFEYDGHDGFLRHMNIRFTEDNSSQCFNLHETRFVNPDHYELGVNIGESKRYILKTINFYNWEQDTYYNDIPITIYQSGEPIHYMLEQDDEFSLEVIENSNDYVKFNVTYYPKGDPQITSDVPIILDKSTGYFTLMLSYHPPILMTTNKSLLGDFFYNMYDITGDELKFYNTWEDPGGQRKHKEEGSWNLTTGWMNFFLREEHNDNRLEQEFEIIAVGYERNDTEFHIGVNVGDVNTIEFTEVFTKNSDNSTSDIFIIDHGGDETPQFTRVKVGDRIEVVIKDISGYYVTIFMKIHSSVDGDVTTDSWTQDISKFPKEEDGGPPFIIPTDKNKIADIFENATEITFDSDSVFIKIEHSDTSRNTTEEYEFDLNTGWVLKIKMVTSENGNEVERISAKSIGITTGEYSDPDNNDDNLTPIPLWPSLIFLVLCAALMRKRR